MSETCPTCGEERDPTKVCPNPECQRLPEETVKALSEPTMTLSAFIQKWAPGLRVIATAHGRKRELDEDLKALYNTVNADKTRTASDSALLRFLDDALIFGMIQKGETAMTTDVPQSTKTYPGWCATPTGTYLLSMEIRQPRIRMSACVMEALRKVVETELDQLERALASDILKENRDDYKD